ncbi:hypothetical protein F0562_008949 [Nyssa sinensis]|uniref:Class II aldolase/adducin N-terminal domain-containing protein n=1 Tax=Nyssa sinensis TaxID=561372 RepID=A0A5J5AAA0_9ASTE|nr:hypothetical protein F0562_008949 [Nyssa sinensis]
MMAASSTTPPAVNGVKMATTSQAYLESNQVKETKELISELCRQFYNLGWVSGTGGSVQKERMVPEDMYVLSPNGSILSSPLSKPYPHKPPKCSDCAPLFLKAYDMRNAGAVIHSHGMESCLVTMINPLSKEFRITHMEMIKGIQGHGYYDELVVPIIENTAHERELTESLAEAMEAYPKTTAVLVRNHGIYVWGDSWISAKTQAECYHYLFDAAIKLHQLKLSHHDVALFWTLKGPQLLFHLLPISFFRMPRDNVGRHLSATYETAETQDDIKLLRSQVQNDLEQGIAGAMPIPSNDAGKEEVIAALVANVEAMIRADRKITALKQLQGHIWKTGFQNHDLEGVVFDDVPEALEKWHALGIKVYIYSSGSRLAQRLLFGKTHYGDLRKYLCGFFDTTLGNKKETRSYIEISDSVGVDNPSDILFVTDVYQEAVAAKAAGLEVIISIRPGNGPLPDNHGFKTIKSFSEI